MFHRFRKGIATQFEQAGIPESEAVRLWGQEIIPMTYGLYSGGNLRFERRCRMTELVCYLRKSFVLESDSNMHSTFFVLLASSALLATPLAAQNAPPSISHCHLLQGTDSRLACYDTATGYLASEEDETTGSLAAEPETPEPRGLQWRISTEISALDGRSDVWLSIPSENTQRDQIGRPDRARLWVRCMQNSTSLFVTFNDFTPDNQNVRYRIDDGSPNSIWMVHMQGGEGIGLWSGRNAIPFIRRLFDRSTLVIGYRSYSNNSLEFEFNISGLQNRIDPLAESCEWSP